VTIAGRQVTLTRAFACRPRDAGAGLRPGGAGYVFAVAELKDQAEETHRSVARGRSEATPVRAHLGVMAAVAVLVGFMLAVALVLWLVLR
jgi:hypothetical protein